MCHSASIAISEVAGISRSAHILKAQRLQTASAKAECYITHAIFSSPLSTLKGFEGHQSSSVEVAHLNQWKFNQWEPRDMFTTSACMHLLYFIVLVKEKKEIYIPPSL